MKHGDGPRSGARGGPTSGTASATLTWREDGTLVLSLKRRRGARGRSSRVRAIVFKPLALIARLAALVPAPYMHLRRFYGVFGPHHKLRVRILPTPPDPATSDLPVTPKRP